MARYPTFEEYRKRGNFSEGIKKCDDLLKKNPNDVQLLTVKLQLTYTVDGNAQAVLDQLTSLHPPLLELGEIAAIEDAVGTSQREVFPSPNTAGPSMAKIWENALKVSNSMNHKLDLLSLRFSRAIVDNRLVDAQQALIQLKALQPKNRVFYMAHAAVTQMLSTSKDDLQSRLALSLARKAVKENFDEDKALDCRVPGQIFALQKSEADLEPIVNRSFKESKQVYDALRKTQTVEVNGTSETHSIPDPASVAPAEWLRSEVQSLKTQFAELISAPASKTAILTFATNSIRLFHTAKTSIPDPRGRGVANACFLSISALVRVFELSEELHYLLIAAFLAEDLLQHNPHVHEARMILIYLYMRLGLGSLALGLFHSLNIKEIQHDTVGHALFTRLSVTHPHSTKLNKRDTFDPAKRLAQALGVYRRHEEKLAESEASALNHEQTGMLFDLRELRNSLRSSLTRRITYLEHKRLARLLVNTSGEDAAQMGPRATANWLETTDNRDFAATFDFGYNVEKVLHSHNWILPGRRWILSSLMADTAWCLATGSRPPVDNAGTISRELMTVDLEGIDVNGNEAIASEPHAVENVVHNLNEHLMLALYHASTDPSASLYNNLVIVESGLEQLKMNINGFDAEADSLTERIQESYLYLDSLRIVIKGCKFIESKASFSFYHSQVKEIQDHAQTYCQSIQKHAKEQMQRIRVDDIKAYMVQDETLADSIKAFGKGSISDFCNSIAASAKEGWEGVTKITPV